MPWNEQKVVIDGPVKMADGYGHMTVNMILAFDHLGYDVRCRRGWDHTDFTDVPQRVRELVEQDRAVTTNDCAVGIRMSTPESFSINPTGYKVGYSMFEFTKLPRCWVEGPHTQTSLTLVPSQWCKEVFEASGIRSVVESNPLGVDTDMFTYLDRPERDVFTFVMSSTMSERKAPWMTWQALKLAFPTQRDVRLILKSPAWLPLPTDVGDDRVTVLNETWPDQRMVDLLHQSDCFLYPTKSEGFGLSPCEAMSTGLPVICTNATSCTEFVREAHSYPLNIDGWETVPSDWGDIGAYTKPSLEHLVELMRHVYEHRAEAKAKGALAAQFIRDNLTWRHNAERTIAIVNKYL